MGEVVVGKYTYGLPLIRRGTHNSISIGNYCSIAQDVIWDGGFDHNYKFVSTYPFNPNMPGCNDLPLNLKTPVKDITVGHDVWIGEGAIIKAGAVIETGAVIGARMVVSGHIAGYTVNTPNKWWPRFTLEQIERLRDIAWWEWTDERVSQNAHLLLSEDIDNFINNHI